MLALVVLGESAGTCTFIRSGDSIPQDVWTCMSRVNKEINRSNAKQLPDNNSNGGILQQEMTSLVRVSYYKVAK